MDTKEKFLPIAGDQRPEGQDEAAGQRGPRRPVPAGGGRPRGARQRLARRHQAQQEEDSGNLHLLIVGSFCSFVDWLHFTCIHVLT